MKTMKQYRPMSTTNENINRLMKRCQIGFGGRDALQQAHDCAADCYRMIGILQIERARLAQALRDAVKHYEGEDGDLISRPTWLNDALNIYHPDDWWENQEEK